MEIGAHISKVIFSEYLDFESLIDLYLRFRFQSVDIYFYY